MAKKKSSGSKIGTILLVLLILIFLSGIALGACIYLGVVDEDKVAWMNEKMGLYKLPIVGAKQPFEYFTVPPGVIWPEPEPESEEEKAKKEKHVAKKEEGDAAKDKDKDKPKKSKDVTLSKEEIEKQTKLREAAEKKRISKLARIYDSMKPEDAAKALDGVEPDTVVLILQKMNEASAANVLSKMEPLMAAQITQMLFEGTQQRVTTPQNPPQPQSQQ